MPLVSLVCHACVPRASILCPCCVPLVSLYITPLVCPSCATLVSLVCPSCAPLVSLARWEGRALQSKYRGTVARTLSPVPPSPLLPMVITNLFFLSKNEEMKNVWFPNTIKKLSLDQRILSVWPFKTGFLQPLPGLWLLEGCDAPSELFILTFAVSHFHLQRLVETSLFDMCYHIILLHVDWDVSQETLPKVPHLDLTLMAPISYKKLLSSRSQR